MITSLDSKCEALLEENLILTKKVFGDKMKPFLEKLAHVYEYFRNLSDCSKALNDFTEEDYFSKLTGLLPNQ